MSKKTCFWCENEVEKDGQLCPSCQKKYDQSQKEYEQIDKEYNELFGNLDCIGMIKLFKTKDQQISDLKAKLKQCKEDCEMIALSNSGLAKMVTEKNQRIAELEEQLKNARTKYFVGYDRLFNPVVREMDLDIILPTYMNDKDFKFYDTKEEAQEKLKELGESK